MNLKTIIPLSLMTVSLLAQTNDELFNMSLEELMNIEVITTSKYAEKATQSPANLFVFTKETIHERGYQTVLDILQSLPSVDIQKFSRALSGTDVAFRGNGGNNKFLILLNGIRISSPAGSSINIGHNFPIYHASQVEVLMGAASVVYGADAFMGVINIVTNNKEDMVEVQATVGTDGYINSFANLSQTLDNGMHIDALMTGFSSQDYKFDEDYPELYTLPTPANVDNGYNFTPTKDLTFFASVSDENYEVGVNHYEHKSSLNFISLPTRSSFDENSNDNSRITSLYTKLKFDLSQKIHSDTTLTYSRLEKDNDTYFKNFFSNFEKAYKYAKTDKYAINEDLQYQLNDQHQISLGLSFEYYDIIPRGSDLTSPYSGSSQNHIGTDIPIDFHEYTYQNYGIYIQDNYKIDDKFRLVLGARYDYNTQYESTFNPRASLIYSFDDRNIFKLLYSSAFLAPASDQIYNEFGSFSGNARPYTSYFYHISNPDLKPETLQTIELNYEHFFENNSHVKIAPYYTKIKDVILEKFNGGVNDTTTIIGANLVNTQYYDNLGKSDIFGVDFTFENEFSFNNIKFKNWFSYSYINSKTDVGSKKSKTPQVAENKLKAGTTFIYNNSIYITPKVSWIGETTQVVYKAGSNERETTPSYFLTDLNMQYKITTNLSIVADIYNLFDEKYYNASSTSDTVNTFKNAPQPGRIISAGLYYKF